MCRAIISFLAFWDYSPAVTLVWEVFLLWRLVVFVDLASLFLLLERNVVHFKFLNHVEVALFRLCLCMCYRHWFELVMCLRGTHWTFLVADAEILLLQIRSRRWHATQLGLSIDSWGVKRFSFAHTLLVFAIAECELSLLHAFLEFLTTFFLILGDFMLHKCALVLWSGYAFVASQWEIGLFEVCSWVGSCCSVQYRSSTRFKCTWFLLFKIRCFLRQFHRLLMKRVWTLITWSESVTACCYSLVIDLDVGTSSRNGSITIHDSIDVSLVCGLSRTGAQLDTCSVSVSISS